MTITAHHPTLQPTPEFPACPSWCRIDHAPDDEIVVAPTGQQIVLTRVHERLLWADVVRDVDHPDTPGVIARVLWERRDDDGTTPGPEHLLVELAAPHGWVRMAPTVEQITAMIAGLTAAVEVA